MRTVGAPHPQVVPCLIASLLQWEPCLNAATVLMVGAVSREALPGCYQVGGRGRLLGGLCLTAATVLTVWALSSGGLPGCCQAHGPGLLQGGACLTAATFILARALCTGSKR